jgi:hypothetical protein
MKKKPIFLIIFSIFVISVCSINENNDYKLKAVNSAQEYLRITSFSKKGLTDQLIHDGFSKSDALYGVNNCNANWYEEAKRSAKTYLKIIDYDKEELIKQLEFEGFAHDEAIYGVKQNGL